MSGIQIFFMILLAVIVDLLNILLTPTIFGSTVVNAGAWVVFYLWFKLNGVSFAEPKKMWRFIGGGISEAIPVWNSFVWWTIFISWTIITVKTEEKLHIKLPQKIR